MLILTAYIAACVLSYLRVDVKITTVMSPGPVSCIGGTKYPHCIVLYCIVKLFVFVKRAAE